MVPLIEFTSPVLGYSPGDQAEFTDAIAEALVAGIVAVSNGWLVRTLASATEAPRKTPTIPASGQTFTGWVH